jgi:repressor LexA
MSSLEQLTDRQRDIYYFLRDKILNRGYGPTVREIGEQFHINSPNGVMCHLKALEKKGLIRRSPNKSRAIELTEDVPRESPGLPYVGVVAAGMTSLAFEQDERIDIGNMFSPKEHFILRVSGDSMIEAQIADGDYVVVKRQTSARPGQIVVAQTDEGEATLKYWYPENGRVRLQPANSTMSPMYLRNVSVLGVVVSVFRKVV